MISKQHIVEEDRVLRNTFIEAVLAERSRDFQIVVGSPGVGLSVVEI